MKAWWFGLQHSERRTLTIGGVVLALMLVYFGGWAPLQNNVAKLEKQVADQEAVKRWMEQAAIQVKQLKARGGAQTQRSSGGSLLALVDQTAKRGRLGSNLKRLEPDGSSSVKVWLEQVSFDDMMTWLINLEQQNGVAVHTITIDRQDQPGRVNARMTLQGGA